MQLAQVFTHGNKQGAMRKPLLLILSFLLLISFSARGQEDSLAQKTGENLLPEDLNHILTSPSDISQALYGLDAGLQIHHSAGLPGSTTWLHIRGLRSLNPAGNQPVIIVDGIQVGHSSIMIMERDWGTGLDMLNPWDIGEVSVMKGNEAAVQSGFRGGNGVIALNSRKETFGKGVTVEFNTRMLTSEVWKTREVQNEFGEGRAALASQEFDQDDQGVNLLPVVDEARPGDSWGPAMNGQPVMWWNGVVLPWKPQPQNADYLFQSGASQTMNFALSGQTRTVWIRSSFTSENTKTVIPGHRRSKTSIHLNSGARLSEKLELGTTFIYVRQEQINPPMMSDSSLSLINYLLWNHGRSWRPELEMKHDPQGEILAGGAGYPVNNALGRGRGLSGPFYHRMMNDEYRLFQERKIGNLRLTWELMPWLTLEGRLGYDGNDYQYSFIPGLGTDSLVGLENHLSRSIAEGIILNHSVRLRLSKKITQKINLEGQAGVEYLGQNFLELGKTWSDSLFLASEEGYQQSVTSAFAQGNLNFGHRFFLNVSGRRDHISTGINYIPVQTYPAAGMGFVFRKTSALSRKSFTYGKFRVDYSVSGNGTWLYPAVADSVMPERNHTESMGVDLEFYKGRIRLNAVYYRTLTTNHLLPVDQGNVMQFMNSGEVMNRGLEFLLNLIPIKKSFVEWKIGANIAINQNEVLSLPAGVDKVVWERFGTHNQLEVAVMPGFPAGVILGYDYQYADQNKNQMVDPEERIPENRLLTADGRWYKTTDDKVILGSVMPKWFGGLTQEIRIGGLKIKGTMEGKFGGDVFYGSHAAAFSLGQAPETLAGRTAELGGLPVADIAGTTRNIGVIKPGILPDGSINQQVVPYYELYQDNIFRPDGMGAAAGSVFRTSWIQIRSLSLTYDFPVSALKRYELLKELSVSLVGYNLWFLHNTAPHNLNPALTGYPGVARGIEWGQLPSVRTYGVWVKMKF